VSKIFVGMSGWTFEGWRKDFYPKGFSQNKELSYASRQVNSIEINGTFYSLQRPSTFQKWFDETPAGFCFAVKGPQYITHIRRLKDVEEPLSNFLASGVFALKEKLGPFLWQFPPNLTFKDGRFEAFLKLLPKDSRAALRLAKRHTDKVKGRNYLKIPGDLPIRHAVEVRHESFRCPEFIELLRRFGVALVFAHAGRKSPYMEDVTADFVYARMHGEGAPYAKGYPARVLKKWAERLKLWTRGSEPTDRDCVSSYKAKSPKRDAFVYFDTEAKVFSPYDAMELAKILSSKISR
jgi:uncharacterized protein YecE (DUF72 family)